MRFAFLVLLLFTACQTVKVSKPTGFTAKNAMVVSARSEASAIGTRIMAQGGNAFDAMVATELALAVAYPYAGNIGGGGMMVYRMPDGETGALDYREMAPMASSRDMFLDASGNVIPGKSINTALAVGVPGTIAGIFEAHRRFGSLPVGMLIQPAIDLAKKGIVVTEKQKIQFDTYRTAINEANGQNMYSRIFQAGDTVKFPKLAATLERILKNGESEFYNGETAKKFVEYIKSNDGIITMKDFAAYRPVWRKTVAVNYRDFKIISMPPPSSGGICLAQILKMIEPYDVKSMGHNSVNYIQLLTEAERRAYADRSHFLGDPDFVNVPVDKLLDKDYLHSRMKSYRTDRASSSAEIGYGKINFSESTETTHYSIVDKHGNAIAATTTLNGAFGSKLYIEELGFFLNNQMDDFSIKPGTPNMYGLVGAEANSIAPGKRMLSSMTPTIVEKGGKLFMTLGTPGGSTIITSVLQTILNVCEFGMSMQQAVDAPRFHHQWLPDEINFEPGKFTTETLSRLQNMGYITNEKTMPVIGKVDAVLIRTNGILEGGADKRGDDSADGF